MFDEFEFEAWRDLTFLVVDWLVIRPSSTKIPPFMAGSEFASGGGISVSWVHFSDDKATHEEVFLKCFFFFAVFLTFWAFFYWSWVVLLFFGPNEYIHGAMDFNLQQRTVRWTSFLLKPCLFAYLNDTGAGYEKNWGIDILWRWQKQLWRQRIFFCAIWHGNCREAKERIGFWILLSFNILPMRNNQSWQSLTVVWHHATSWNWRRENSHQKLDKFSWLQHTTCEKSHPILPGYW